MLKWSSHISHQLVDPLRMLPKTMGLVNHYLGTLRQNNLSKQRTSLVQLYKSDADNDLKLSCLHLLLQNYLSHSRFINPRDLWQLIADFNIVTNHDDHIKRSLANCLLHSYKNSSAKQSSSLAKYISDTLGELEISDQELATIVDPGLHSALVDVAKHTKKDIKLAAATDDLLDIDTRKRNGLLDLDGLLGYVSVPFDTSIDTPIYEYYDKLDDTKKAQFMEKYLEFNKTKQNNIEHNCLSIINNIKSNFEGVESMMATNNEMVSQWLGFSEKLLSLTGKNSDEKMILKYSNYLKLLGYDSVVELVLSHLLMHTMQEEARPLYSTISKIGFAFTRLLYSKTKFTARFLDNEAVRLFSSITKLLIDHCTVSTPKSFVSGDLEKFNDKLFVHELKSIGKKQQGILLLHPYVYFRLSDNISFKQSDQLFLPMLCSPKPWTAPDKGGYLNDIKHIVSHKYEKAYVHFLNQANQTGQLDFMYSNLNYMGSTPWCLDQEMLSIFNKAYKLPLGFVNIPPELKHIKKQKGPDSKLVFERQKSKRIKYDLLHKVSNAFKDNILFFPHNVDFRGRVYPMVSVLSYQDEDISRSLLQFWSPQPLGPNGLNWLKYQLAGLYGKDKLPMEERCLFIDKNYQNILDSAKNPFNTEWWMKADNPWQLLRLCIEFSRISKYDGHIEDYKCRIPIHQDGSCNGLQHYAALSRDFSGGKAVNLVPSEDRQDIYNEVLEILVQKLDLSDPIDAIASKIVSRKLIKRPIMTQVYGVTRFGSVQQIFEELSGYNLNEYFNADQLEFYYSNRLTIVTRIAQLIFSSISELFRNLVVIQDWIYKNTLKMMNSICQSDIEHEVSLIDFNNHKPMMWTSVSGFPVIQLYDKPKKSMVETGLQTFSVQRYNTNNHIDTSKQLNGVAPNFIHSLDSIHLLLTCFKCNEKNIPFAAVHDSFWTNAKDVDELAKILRKAFIELHSSQPLEFLYSDMMNTLKNCFHIVWIKNTDNEDLVNQIIHHRGGKFTKTSLNKKLLQEIQDSDALEHFNKLLSEHQPHLYLKKGSLLVSYNDINKDTIKFSLKDFTPVPIQASVLPPPPTGELDINNIVHSKYFFS